MVSIEYVTCKPCTDIETIRELAAMMASYAATGGTMIATVPCPLSAPIYSEVTMGLLAKSKKEGWYFSSCAYLCHWVLECLGLEDLPAIGRTGKADNPLSRLAYHPLSEPIKADTAYRSGDCVQIGSTNLSAHIYMALADTESRDTISPDSTGILGAHYGQEGLTGDTDLHPSTAPEPIGGAVRLLPIKRQPPYHQVHGTRDAMRKLDLSKLLGAAIATPLGPLKMNVPRLLWDWPGFARLQGRLERA